VATLSQFGYALAVDRHRNFRRAAKACFISQPTLSMQLAKLEDELAVVLFDRSRRPVVPTREGAVLLEQFRTVMREYERIEEVVQELRGVIAGPYRLGIIPTMAPTILPLVVPRFVAAHPAVEIQIEELTTARIVERLAQETLDGGMLATPLHVPTLTEYAICREQFVVFHSPTIELRTDAQGRVRLDALPLERLMVMREGHCLRTQTLDLCALGAEASETQGFVLEAGSLATLCAMVQNGPYFTILPALAAAELEARGLGDLIKSIAGKAPFREVALVTRRIENRRAIREALIDVAREALEPLEDKRRRLRAQPVEPLAS